jgi:uncharacterized protein
MLHFLRLVSSVSLMLLGMGSLLAADPIRPSYESVRGPSFSCDGDLTNVEEMLCFEENLLLGPLDRLLAAVYADLSVKVATELPVIVDDIVLDYPYRSMREFQDEQIEWLAGRRQFVRSDQLENYYKKRIRHLASSYAEINGNDGGSKTHYMIQPITDSSECEGWAPDDTLSSSGHCVLREVYVRYFSIVIANGHFAAFYESHGRYYNSCRAAHFGAIEELSRFLTIRLTYKGIELGSKKLGSEEYSPTEFCSGPTHLVSYGGFYPH